jgi:hypothetical protein
VEGDDGVGLAVELDNGHSDRFSGSPGEATAMKDFRQYFRRVLRTRAVRLSCIPTCMGGGRRCMEEDT